MTEHLPECWAKHDSDPPAWCICDELRACEERVRRQSVSQIKDALNASLAIRDRGLFDDGTGSEDASERAYHRGLRDATALIVEHL